VPAAISLLRQIAEAPTPPQVWAGPPRRKTPVTAGGAPPHVVAAFEHLEQLNTVYAPTTDLLRSFHGALGSRTADRAALLAVQMRSPDPGTRLDAIRMAGDLMQAWRGDHSTLITLVAGQLDAESCQVAAEAAAVLESCHLIAKPARETLAEHVAAQRAVHGSDVWAAPDERLRRAHQNAVRALARLGDSRAVPSLLAALDGDVDAWRAIEVAGDLPQAAGQLARRLIEHLRRVDIAAQGPGFEMGTRALLLALGRLGDPAAVPPITETLATAIHHQQWSTATSALAALAALGPASTPALEHIRALTSSADAQVRAAAIKALWAVGDDREAMLPLLLQNLQESDSFLAHDAAELLGQIGPAAAAAVPRLRELLTNSYEWTRIYAAAALWDIAAEAETPVVLDTLLAAWAKNGATANFVIQCLDRMGPAAAAALPQLRAELTQIRRGGRFGGIDNDEKLQDACRALIARLG
jgi:HEAT repeat protein